MPNLFLNNTTTTVKGKGPVGIIKDNLVLNHNYQTKSVVPVSDGAAFFDGTDDYIQIGAKPVDTADATYVFWINCSETGDNRVVFSHGAANKGGFTVNHHSTGKPLLYLNSSLYQYWDDVPAQDDGQWHHWAVVVDVDDMTACKLYVDGALQTQSSRSTSDVASAYENLRLGRGDSEYWEGYMCNFGVWSGHLTQPQIKSIMNKNYAGLTSSEKTNLVSWWNLDAPITEDYAGIGEGDAPSAIDGLVLDNHDTTLTEVSLTNSDFTSGSGTTITDWNNTSANKWERSGDTIISPNGVSLFRRNSALTNNVAHKIIVRAKNTIPGSTARLQVYFGGNNHARYDLTDDFQEYVFHGLQTNDTTFILYNPSGGDSTNVTIDWVKLYKYDGNVGLLV